MKRSTGKAGERRQHERLDRPQLYLRIGGHTFQTTEWSYGGLVIEDLGGILPTGALLRIDGLSDEESYRHAQPPYQVDIRARVVRVMPETRQAALTCLKLDDAAYRILSGIENGNELAIAN
ncbi:MAG: hypothetical protein JJ900_02110 [Rhodospirillales bacterium]|nr:hypothetical protein [Rhodospirillales bacterium]MBO6785616.1 hypothetical protein [Rhodospirillales bacterium]